MCTEYEVHFRVADIDVGMMGHLLRDRRHFFDERNAVGKRREVIALHERVAFARPPGEGAESALDFDVREGCHVR